MLKGKHIILGITGSIAAYKAAYIIRALVKKGAEVQVVITPAGKEFITPITLSALSSNPVISDFFSNRDGTWHSHVDLGLWADAMLIAPATASTIGKMANGIADNMLVTTYLSCKAPVFIAPAMDLDMFAHPTTQQNLERLRSFGNHIIEPAEGELASHLVGKGRMEEPDKIVRMISEWFDNETSLRQLTGRHIMITAGPTYEKIDPVRFIGNYSSGKMGFAIAEECLRRGANVTLIAGPVNLSCSEGIRRIDVESCEEMYEAALKVFPNTDAAILAAAVADFKPEQQCDRKIKHDKGNMTLHLKTTTDIAASLGKLKTERQCLIAFALETDNEEQNAMHKLKSKNADFIVLNSMRNKGTCFQSDNNQITIIGSDRKKQFPIKSKIEAAGDIVDEMVEVISHKSNDR